MNQAIGIASDHGGKILKARIIEFLTDAQFSIKDFGIPLESNDSVDYPDFAAKVAAEVSSGQLERGILVCGTGIGMSIAANRFPKVRATLVWDEFTAKASRNHNSSNILCLGERVLNHDRALEYVKIWLDEAPGTSPRHQRRTDKIEMLGKTSL